MQFQEDNNNINKSEKPMQSKRWKMLAIFVLLNVGFFALVVKLFVIQVVDSDKYQKKARSQHEAKELLKADRGNIYDRNGNLLASTIHSISLALDPNMLTKAESREKLCKELEAITGIPAKNMLDKINATDKSFIWLARGISADKKPLIDKMKYSGLIKTLEPKRNYLYGGIAAQIIGCTNVDNKGLTGIELGWDSVLAGTSGYMVMLKDAKGNFRPSNELPFNPAQHGNSVSLTIDINLQKIVEYELKQGIQSSQSESGTVIAIEPQTGDILAIASYPSFNPNDMANVTVGSRIRAISDYYEPGSTFKILTAAAALEEHIIRPEDIVDGNNGKLQVKDVTIKDDHPLGRVTFFEAFQNSSNIVFSNLANTLPEEKFYNYLVNFNFGAKTGIEIPGEVVGKMKKLEQLTPIAKRFLGFGYGIGVTPLQLACAYAAVANGGVMMRPRIIKEVLMNDGETVKQFRCDTLKKVMSPENAKILAELLTGVVEGGTGKNAKIEGIKIAGKTGTAQQLVEGSYKKGSYIASFAGFFPADNPKVAMIVILDKPTVNYYGGTVAAPIFRNIVQRWLSIAPKFYYADAQSTPRDNTNVAPSNNIIQDSTLQTNVVFDKAQKPVLKGLTLRKAIKILHENGFAVKVQGSGTVQSQTWTKDIEQKMTCNLNCK